MGLEYQPSGNPGALDLNTDVAFTLSGTSLKNITGNIGKTALTASVNYKQASRPFVDVALQTGLLRLDPFMPAEAQRATKVKAASKSASRQGSTTTNTTSSSGKWSREKIDLSGLKGLDAKIRMSAEGLTKEKITLRNVVMNADLKDGVLDVLQASANLFGGQAKLASRIVASDRANITSDFSASNLNVARILSQTGSKTSAGGTVDLSGQVRTQGQSEFDFVNNLNGVVNMGVQKISVGKKGKGGSPLDILNLLAGVVWNKPK